MDVPVEAGWVRNKRRCERMSAVLRGQTGAQRWREATEAAAGWALKKGASPTL